MKLKFTFWVLWVLCMALIASTLPSGITISISPKMSMDEIFAQTDDLNINSSDVNKSSNKKFTGINLTSSLLVSKQLNETLNFNATATSSPYASSRAATSSPSPVSSVTNEVKGDFNGDGFDDLAIGVPFEDVITEAGTLETAGAVNIVYGSSSGLYATIPRSDQFWTQDTLGVDDVAEAFDGFGYTLSAGDFNGDGKHDLAVGVIGEDVITEAGVKEDAGAVNIIYGSSNGLSATSPMPDQLLMQGNAGISGIAEDTDDFGFSLAVADFNSDGEDDLAVGVLGEDVVTAAGNVTDAGAVNVIYGSSSGLSDTTPSPDQFFVQGFDNVNDLPEDYDYLGYSLSASDFNSDGKDDLAMGAPAESVVTSAGSIGAAGAVNVIYGSSTGLSATSPISDQFLVQGNAGVNDIAEADDIFGYSTVAADFNGDAKADLAIGAPQEDVGAVQRAGGVNVIYGSSTGLSATSSIPDQFLVQGNASVNDIAEADDVFGYSLSAANFNGDKINGQDIDDLAIGVISEDVVAGGGTITDAGAVSVIYGSSNGLSAVSPLPDQFLVQGVLGIDNVAENSDLLGVSLNADDFNGDGKGDISIGVYGEDFVSPEGTILNAGAVSVIYGSSNGLSAVSPLPDQFLTQGNAGVDDNAEADDAFGFSLG